MPEVFEKATKNFKDRFQALIGIPENAKDMVLIAKDELMDLRPGKAVVHVIKHVGDGVLDMVEEQLDITRRWI